MAGQKGGEAKKRMVIIYGRERHNRECHAGSVSLERPGRSPDFSFGYADLDSHYPSATLICHLTFFTYYLTFFVLRLIENDVE